MCVCVFAGEFHCQSGYNRFCQEKKASAISEAYGIQFSPIRKENTVFVNETVVDTLFCKGEQLTIS
jgi:hypothetical protein